MQPSWDILTTSGNATLLLSKLPQSAKQAYHIPSLTNNLLSVAFLANPGCFFTKQDVTFNGEIILQGWCNLTTRLWRTPLQAEEGNIVPCDACIVESTEPTPQACNMYVCENTDQLIKFYYATMNSPVVSTFYKEIDKGYFHGWNGLTSKRVRHLIKPSEHNLLGTPRSKTTRHQIYQVSNISHHSPRPHGRATTNAPK
ncbi:LOW QUALITY PROTEIN: hypothetical protein ACHAW6_005094 [Cyclotella cf. meneghiniana]